MESILGKKLLFLGGTPAIRKVVEKAKSMGIFTIVIDYYANDDYLHSPAKRIADESYQISAFDIEGVIRCCRSKRIDGIFCCYSDSLLPVCLQICEKLK
ncbi:MAG: hypothetical protein FWC57_04870, partial [Endomicrobia bacterium]|nr:hypothetical protein [Endomicrobiia bacterium]